MHKIIFFSFLSFISTFFTNAVSADCYKSVSRTPEMVLGLEKYVESGQYVKEIEAKILQAKDYLDGRLKNRGNQQFAIVLDIDETALSNYRTLKQHHFSTNREAFTASYLFDTQEAIGPVLGLFHYAKQRGIQIFFVTDRPNTPEIIAHTIRNLKQVGYDGWKEIYLLPLSHESVKIAEFKKQSRQKITDLGYTILLNIGDQSDDVMGGLAEISIQLPNPFYTHTISG